MENQIKELIVNLAVERLLSEGYDNPLKWLETTEIEICISPKNSSFAARGRAKRLSVLANLAVLCLTDGYTLRPRVYRYYYDLFLRQGKLQGPTTTTKAVYNRHTQQWEIFLLVKDYENAPMARWSPYLMAGDPVHFSRGRKREAQQFAAYHDMQQAIWY